MWGVWRPGEDPHPVSFSSKGANFKRALHSLTIFSERHARPKHNRHQGVHHHENICISSRKKGRKVHSTATWQCKRLTKSFSRHARSNILVSNMRKLFFPYSYLNDQMSPTPLQSNNKHRHHNDKSFDAPSMQEKRVRRYWSTCRIGIEEDALSSFVCYYAGQGRRLCILIHHAFVPRF